MPFATIAEARPGGAASVLAGLSHALDITEGHPLGHAERSCTIGLGIADAIGLPPEHRAELIYGTLLKDAGCSSNAARVYQLFGGSEHELKHAVWRRDWRRLSEKLFYALRSVERGGSVVAKFRRLASLAALGPNGGRELFEVRCERGAQIARKIGLNERTADAIRDMDEHWDGGGYPRGLRGEDIPLNARIMGLAQVMEIFWHDGGPSAAVSVARARSGRWFDPQLVAATAALDDAFWKTLEANSTAAMLAEEISDAWAKPLTPVSLDEIAEGFALIIDGKSPFTYHHSRNVAGYAVAIGRGLGLDARTLTRLRRAALVHDLGKLTVPNSILDKPTALSADEWTIVQQHPRYTFDILRNVPALSEIALDAASHHERIDGRGYHRGIASGALSLSARILAVADVMDALAATRPYRAAMPAERVLDLLQTGSGTQFCAQCVDTCSVEMIESPGDDGLIVNVVNVARDGAATDAA